MIYSACYRVNLALGGHRPKSLPCAVLGRRWAARQVELSGRALGQEELLLAMGHGCDSLGLGRADTTGPSRSGGFSFSWCEPSLGMFSMGNLSPVGRLRLLLVAFRNFLAGLVMFTNIGWKLQDLVSTASQIRGFPILICNLRPKNCS